MLFGLRDLFDFMSFSRLLISLTMLVCLVSWDGTSVERDAFEGEDGRKQRLKAHINQLTFSGFHSVPDRDGSITVDC